MNSDYDTDFGLAYWEGALSAFKDEVHALECAVGMGLGESRIASRLKQCNALLARAKQQEERIHELECCLSRLNMAALNATHGLPGNETKAELRDRYDEATELLEPPR